MQQFTSNASVFPNVEAQPGDNLIQAGNTLLANTLLEQFNSYILALARRRLPRNVVPPEVRDLEIHELAQNTRLKFWQALCRGPVSNPKGYINAIIRTEVTDMVRRYQRALPLPLSEDGELQAGTSVPLWSSEVVDPADTLERDESLAEQIARATASIRSLPGQQRAAMLAALQRPGKAHHLSDVLPLLEALINSGVDLQASSAELSRDERLRANASLHIARQKLRKQMQQPYVIQTEEKRARP